MVKLIDVISTTNFLKSKSKCPNGCVSSAPVEYEGQVFYEHEHGVVCGDISICPVCEEKVLVLEEPVLSGTISLSYSLE